MNQTILKMKADLLKHQPDLDLVLAEADIRETRNDQECPTAYVCFRGIGLQMVFNLNFLEGLDSDKQRRSILQHECLHVLFGHLHSHLGHNAKISNICADAVINEFITDLPEQAVKKAYLPFMIFKNLLLAGNKGIQKEFEPLVERLRDLNLSNTTNYWPSAILPRPNLHLTGLIVYFKTCMEFLKEEFGQDLDLDEYVLLDGIPDLNGDQIEELEIFESDFKARVGGPVLDRISNNDEYGSIHYDLSVYAKVHLEYENQVVWQEVLRNAIMGAQGEDPTPSWKKLNRRLGVYAAGSARSNGADIGFVIDTSGSVSKTRLAEIEQELQSLIASSMVASGFPVFYGDTQKSGMEPFHGEFSPEKVRGGGGTDMCPIIRSAHEHGAKTILIFTDGGLPKFTEVGVEHHRLIWLYDHRNPPNDPGWDALMPGLRIQVGKGYQPW